MVTLLAGCSSSAAVPAPLVIEERAVAAEAQQVIIAEQQEQICDELKQIEALVQDRKNGRR